MKKFRALLSVSLRSMLTAGSGRRSKKGRTVSGMGMMLLMAFVAVYISSTYSFILLDALAPIGMESMLFIYMGIGALATGLLFTVFAVKGVVFGGKDNDLLLALPVPSTLLMTSRVVAIYLENLVFSFFMIVPAGVICAMVTGQGTGRTLLFWVRTVIAAVLLPLLDTALSVAVGALLAFLSSKTSKSNLGQNIFMAVFLVVVFWFSFNLNGILADLMANAQQIKAQLSWAMPAVWMADGIMGDWMALLLFALSCVIPFIAVVAVLGKVYRKAVTSFHNRAARSDYRLSAQRFTGQTKALLKKEAGRFFGTPAYLWNAGLGLMFLLVIAVAALVKRDALQELAGFLPPLPVCVAVIGFCLSTCIITAPSISLEGRYFWILREAPLEEKRLIWVKVWFQIMLSVPCAVIAAVCLTASVRLNVVDGLLLAVLSVVFAVAQACFGMLVGLAFPKLDAVNETVVIKQSMASLLAMFGPMLVLVAAGVLYWLIGLWAGVAVLILFALACVIVLNTRGATMLRYLV